MSKIIIYTQENGNMGVCIPNPKLDIDFVKEKDCPNGIIVDTTVVENLDKDFFDGYEIVNDEPVINLSKAKSIWKDKIRLARKSALEKLDIEVMKAQESGTDITDIVNEKQILRDLPSDVDGAKTVDEIKNVWSNNLGDK